MYDKDMCWWDPDTVRAAQGRYPGPCKCDPKHHADDPWRPGENPPPETGYVPLEGLAERGLTPEHELMLRELGLAGEIFDPEVYDLVAEDPDDRPSYPPEPALEILAEDLEGMEILMDFIFTLSFATARAFEARIAVAGTSFSEESKIGTVPGVGLNGHTLSRAEADWVWDREFDKDYLSPWYDCPDDDTNEDEAAQLLHVAANHAAARERDGRYERSFYQSHGRRGRARKDWFRRLLSIPAIAVEMEVHRDLGPDPDDVTVNFNVITHRAQVKLVEIVVESEELLGSLLDAFGSGMLPIPQRFGVAVVPAAVVANAA